MKKKLTTIIPVFNKVHSLKSTLDSVISNIGISLDQYELILVDDESSDGSETICVDYYKSFDFIEYVRIVNDGLPSPSRARNIGMRLSRGEYIHFLDADDQLCGSFYHDGISYLDHNPNIDIFIRSRYVDAVPVILNFNERLIYGPPLSSCIFRNSIKQFEFENIWLEDIIYTRKLLYHFNSYFDQFNFNSYNYNWSKSELNLIAEKNINGDWVKYVVNYLSKDAQYPYQLDSLGNIKLK